MSETKKRVTLHSGRKGRNGVFMAGHNDRSKKMGEADHIDEKKSEKNIYRNVGGNQFDTFEEAELNFYQNNFLDGLEAKNARYRKNGHRERVKKIEGVYRDSKTGPEETILQIGTRDQKLNPKLIDKIIMEQIEWEQKNFPQLYYLSYGLHMDEPDAAPHVHARRVWIAHDKDGYEIPSERRALSEMGIERPDPAKKEGRFNNAKMTFTARCRQHFQELCKSYGLEIETTPRERGKSGRSLDELKTETAKKDLAAIHDEVDHVLHEVDELKKEKNDLAAEMDEARKVADAVRGYENGKEILAKITPEVVTEGGIIRERKEYYKLSKRDYTSILRLAEDGAGAAAALFSVRHEKEQVEADLMSERYRRKKAENERDAAQEELAKKKQRDFQEWQESAVWREAPVAIKKKVRALADEAKMRSPGIHAAIVSVFQQTDRDIDETKRICGKLLNYLGVETQDRSEYIRNCYFEEMRQRKGAKPSAKGEDAWHVWPESTNFNEPIPESVCSFVASMLPSDFKFSPIPTAPEVEKKKSVSR